MPSDLDVGVTLDILSIAMFYWIILNSRSRRRGSNKALSLHFSFCLTSLFACTQDELVGSSSVRWSSCCCVSVLVCASSRQAVLTSYNALVYLLFPVQKRILYLFGVQGSLFSSNCWPVACCESLHPPRAIRLTSCRHLSIIDSMPCAFFAFTLHFYLVEHALEPQGLSKGVW